MRLGRVERNTEETKISVELKLDGTGLFQGESGIGFFDHMLRLLSVHSHIDLTIQVAGDLQVDGHHMVEDVGICLGRAFAQALGEKEGVRRYGWSLLPMDETLVMVVVDLSGRPYLSYTVPELAGARLGEMDGELVREFFQAVVNQGGLTLHVQLLNGENKHHIAEAIFKGFALALRHAVRKDASTLIPSSKGTLV